MEKPGYRLLQDESNRRMEPMQMDDGEEQGPSPLEACVDLCRLRASRFLVSALTCGLAVKAVSYSSWGIAKTRIRCQTSDDDWTPPPDKEAVRHEKLHPLHAKLSYQLGYQMFQPEYDGGPVVDFPPDGQPGISYSYGSTWTGRNFGDVILPVNEPAAVASGEAIQVDPGDLGDQEGLRAMPMPYSGGGGSGGGGDRDRTGPWLGGTHVPSNVFINCAEQQQYNFDGRTGSKQIRKYSAAAARWGGLSLTAIILAIVATALAMPIAFLTVVGKGGGVRLHRTSKKLLRFVVAASAVLAVAVLLTACWGFLASSKGKGGEEMADTFRTRLQSCVDSRVDNFMTVHKISTAPPYPAWESCVLDKAAMREGIFWAWAVVAALATNAGVNYVALRAPGRAEPGGAAAWS